MLSALAACFGGALRIVGDIPAGVLATHLLARLAARLVGLLPVTLRRLAAFLARLRRTFAVIGEISPVLGHSHPPLWLECVNKTARPRRCSKKNEFQNTRHVVKSGISNAGRYVFYY